MSTLKVNTIQSNTTSELDINSPLGTIPSLDVIGSATIGGNLNAVGVITATTLNGNLSGNVTGTINSTGISTFSGGVIVAAGSTSAPSISPTGDSNTGIFFPSSDTIAFAEGGVEALRIDSSGNVGINTANPQDKLTVLGKIHVHQDSSSNNRIILRAQPSSSYRWNIDNYSSSNTFRIYREDDATSASGAVAIEINASTRNVSLYGGNLAFDSGKGIDFSATANSSGTMTSELLSDYEEGTWTPTIPGTSITYSSQQGIYTKIGNVVYIRFYVVLSGGTPSGSSPGGQIVGGLPFTSTSTHYMQLTTTTSGCNFGGTIPIAQVNPSSTVITGLAVANNGAFVDATPTSVWDANGNWLQCCGFYYVA